MRTSVVVLVLAVVLNACASGLSVAVPTAPGAAQTEAQVARDAEHCTKDAATKDQRETVYAACMIARGYWTTVYAARDTYMDVFGGLVRTPASVLDDVGVCRVAAERAVEEAGGMGARVGAAMLFGMAGVGLQVHQGAQAREAFMACLTPKGYDVRRWTPDMSKKR